MKEELVCQKIKCSDYLPDDGEPAWCVWACCPAMVATRKCPKVADYQKQDTPEGTAKTRSEK